MTKKEPATLFGRRLREARRRADIPQDRLGVQIGLDEGTASARMSRYETGTHEPPFGIALKLAQALQLPAAYFYCEDDELAELLLAWARLSRKEHSHIKSLIETLLARKHGYADEQ
ncbi:MULTISPECIES: helix-turn-helix domain-containing protein [Cupriavidus]